jgi:alpha-glucosidase
MDGYRVFTWDKSRFPDPTKMHADLKAQGFRTVIIIDPGIKVDPNYSVYTDGQKGGYFHKDASGKEFNASVWPGVCAFPDFTDPRARA